VILLTDDAVKTLLRLSALLACLVGTNGIAAVVDAAAWQRWSPRDEIAPEFSREAGSVLKIKTRNAFDFGAWKNTIAGVRAGQDYTFVAWFRTEGVEDERRSVIARLQWLDAAGKPVKVTVRPPEYPLDVAREKGWGKMESVVRAPEGATALEVQLSLGFAAQGTVWWDRVALSETAAPRERIVRAMTVNHRPRGLKSAAANVDSFAKIVRGAAGQKPDIVCLPEGMTVVGTGKSYVDVSEPVPGPTTEKLGELARELRCYIVAGLYERVGPVVYNTAVLIDREGKFAGRYRKTHLPREEWEAGITPGESYPVFETDFGKLGLMICWDVQFPEPWRALGLQRAELVLMPIWGGSETLMQARAMENHLFVVSSGYGIKSCIVAPDGKILQEAAENSAVTVALNLDQKIYQPWIGDMSTRTWKERRGELPRGGP
jgi:predicted amidohydrolase